MKTTIYFFSGTGNSLTVARELADKIGCDIISIPSVTDSERIETEAEASGIVFPVYYAMNASGIPLIVQPGEIDRSSRRYALGRPLDTYQPSPYSVPEKVRSIVMRRDPRRRREEKLDEPGPIGALLQAPLRMIEKPLFMARYWMLAESDGDSFESLIPPAECSFRIDESRQVR